jgi:hypothetical protein
MGDRKRSERRRAGQISRLVEQAAMPDQPRLHMPALLAMHAALR